MADNNITCFPGVFVSDDEVRMRNRLARFISMNIFGKKIVGIARTKLFIVRRFDKNGEETHIYYEDFRNIELVFEEPLEVRIDLEKLFESISCDDNEYEMDTDRCLIEKIFGWETRFEDAPVSLEEMLEYDEISENDYKKIVNAVAKELKINKIKGA